MEEWLQQLENINFDLREGLTKEDWLQQLSQENMQS